MSAEGKTDCTQPVGITPLVVLVKVGDGAWATVAAELLCGQLLGTGLLVEGRAASDDETPQLPWLEALEVLRPQAFVIIADEAGQRVAFQLGYAYNMLFHESPGILLMPQPLEVARMVFASRPGVDLAIAAGDMAALVELTANVATRNRGVWPGMPTHLPNLLWRKNGNVVTTGGE
jgi:hypothetical protein